MMLKEDSQWEQQFNGIVLSTNTLYSAGGASSDRVVAVSCDSPHISCSNVCPSLTIVPYKKKKKKRPSLIKSQVLSESAASGATVRFQSKLKKDSVQWAQLLDDNIFRVNSKTSGP